MPVQRFRSFDEAERALAKSAPADGDVLARRVGDLWAFSAALAAPLRFRGVRKYRTLEEADEDRRRLRQTAQR